MRQRTPNLQQRVLTVRQQGLRARSRPVGWHRDRRGSTRSSSTPTRHDARAKFSPINTGAKTELQVKTIKDGAWKTISTDKQRASGYTYFQISDPLEVAHQYRAVANGITTNTVSFAAPLASKNTACRPSTSTPTTASR